MRKRRRARRERGEELLGERDLKINKKHLFLMVCKKGVLVFK